MALRRVQVTDFRCLHRADVVIDGQFTLISGPNASGKTSLLEAIYVLGRGRSFRSQHLSHLIRAGAERLIVFGEVEMTGGALGMGVEASATGVRAKLAGERVVSLAELAAAFPVQIIDPEVHRLIEEGPVRRRRFLDWGAFHVEPSFLSHWQLYTQILRQRNAALRSHTSTVAAWSPELVRYGEWVTEARQRYVARLLPIAQQLVKSLLGLELSLVYRLGWPKDLSLPEALAHSLGNDQELGATQVGPQRAELLIRLEGLPAKDRISRGQQKLLAAALLIAQIKVFPEPSPIRPTLLLDDPAAELDAERLRTLIQEVRAEPMQLIVTTLHESQPEVAGFGVPGRHYRLDQGRVRAD